MKSFSVTSPLAAGGAARAPLIASRPCAIGQGRRGNPYAPILDRPILNRRRRERQRADSEGGVFVRLLPANMETQPKRGNRASVSELIANVFVRLLQANMETQPKRGNRASVSELIANVFVRLLQANMETQPKRGSRLRSQPADGATAD